MEENNKPVNKKDHLLIAISTILTRVVIILSVIVFLSEWSVAPIIIFILMILAMIQALIYRYVISGLLFYLHMQYKDELGPTEMKKLALIILKERISRKKKIL